jgi:hypothetical protein
MSTLPDEDQTTFTEQAVEDRVYHVQVVTDHGRIYVLHQAASRVLRKDMSTVLKKSLKEFDTIDLDEFVHAVEAHAVEVEQNFIRVFSSEERSAELEEIRAGYLAGSTVPIPTFDFEQFN